MAKSFLIRVFIIAVLLSGFSVLPATAQGPEADLSLTMLVDDATPTVGQVVTFTLALTNNGPDDVTVVEVTDLMPAGLSVSSIPGVYDSGTGVWTVGALTSGSTATLNLNATVGQEALPDVINTAEVTLSDLPDPDSTPGDGMGDDYAEQTITPDPPLSVIVTNLNDDGVGSLRWATQVVADGGAINFQGGLTGTITLTSGQVFLDRNLIINGPGAGVITVDHNGPNHFLVEDPDDLPGVIINVSISGLTLTGGNINTAGGGSINVGGENLTLTDMIITGNTVSGGGANRGGAVMNNGGSLIVNNSEFSNNTNDSSGGAIYNNGGAVTINSGSSFTNNASQWAGGAIENAGGSLVVTQTTFTGNRMLGGSSSGGAIYNNGGTAEIYDCFFDGGGVSNADSGGAIYNTANSLLVLDSTFVGNDVNNNGGAIASLGTNSEITIINSTFVANNADDGGSILSGPGSTAIISGSTFSANTAQNGGAFFNGGTLDIYNSTFTGNTADEEGGAFAFIAGFTLTNVTITNNTADLDNNGTGFGGGLRDVNGSAAVSFQNTILAGNFVGPNGAAASADCWGTHTSLGNNVVGAGTGCPAGGAGDQTIAPALVATQLVSPLDANGGPTLTHALPLNSIAINNGDAAACADAGTVNSLDQRGVVRPQGTACDVGAYEADVDLEVTKIVDNELATFGENVVFTITVTNNGPGDAINVVVTDLLPAELLYVSDDGGGAYVPGTGVWTVGDLADGASDTLNITATVDDTATIVNTAAVTASPRGDYDPTNDSDTATVTPSEADLSLTKGVDNATPNVGESVVFTLTLTNSGPDTANNIEVTDLLPAGLAYVSDDGGGAYDDGTGVWTVASLGVGSTTLNITAMVEGGAVPSATNAAEVTASDQYDPDSTPGDGAGDDYAEATVTPIYADLTLTKSGSTSAALYGSATFYIEVTNNGPDTATNIEVTDVLPAGLNYFSDTPSQGTYNEVTGVWTVGDLADGASATLELNVTVGVDAIPSVTNAAEVTAVDQYDDTSTPGDGMGDDYAELEVTIIYADLSLTKTVDDPTPNVGQNVFFTITLSNAAGGSAATNIEVVDVLPAGLTFVNATAGLGAYNTGTHTWTIASLPAGASATLDIEATVEVGAVPSATNSAEVTAVTQPDPDSTPGDGMGDDYAEATVTPQVADLTLTKGVDDATPNVGESVVFTLTLTNNGPDTATNIDVTDALPAGLAYASDDGGGAYDDGTGVWTVASLGVGSATLNITATVEAGAVGGVTNAAEVTASDQYDDTSTPGDGMGDDYAEATVTPIYADLTLTKGVDDATPNVGESVVFTLTLTNNGPDTATNIAVTDLLPAGLAYASDDGGGAYDDGTGVWTVASLGVGSSTLNITATVEAGAVGGVTNAAEVTASDQYDDTSTPGDGMGDDYAEATVTPIYADLTLTKTVDTATPNVGESVVFTLTLTNNGPDTANNIAVTDVLPAGLAYASDDGGGAYDDGTGVWTVASLGVGSVTLNITATVEAGAVGGVTNAAEVTASDQYDDTSTPGDGMGDDYAEATVTPIYADLTLTKGVDDATPNVGESVVFTLTLTNNGPDTANNIAVTDLLPAGLAYVSDDGGGAYDDGTGVWTVASLGVGSTTLNITATVEAGAVGGVTNAAEVTASDQYDDTSTPGDGMGDDYAEATVTPIYADLTLTKTVDTATPNVGESVVFTLTLTNNGPDTANNIAVTDLLPAGLAYVSDDGGGAYDDGTGVWTVASLGVGSTTLNITATVEAGAVGGVTNAAEVTASDQYDDTSTPGDGMGDDYAEATVTPQVADLSLTKTVDVANPNPNDTIVYTLTLTNSGPDTATNIDVTDLLPAGVTYASDDGGGAYNNGTGVWTVASLGVGSATLNITATVDNDASGTITNEAEVTAVDQYDSDSTPGDGVGDDYASADIMVSFADLSLTKTVDDATPNVGDSVVFTLTVTNGGPDPATNVAVTDLLPAGLAYASDDGGGAYVPGTGVWTVGDLAVSGSATLNITATVEAGAVPSVTNAAEVTAVDQGDPDSTPGDGMGDDYAEATVTPQVADLTLSKTVDDATPQVGDSVIFTLTVTNNGPDTATNIEVTDLLPAGLAYASDDGGGAYVSGTGVWTVGDLAVSGSATLNITATVQAGAVGGVTNAAEVTAVDQYDDTSTPGDGAGDDYAEATVTPQVADLTLSKSVNNATPNVGQTVMFTLTLTNNGPDTATNIEVTDLLPAGLAYLGDDGGGAYNNGTGVWTVASLGVGSATLNITATVEAGAVGGVTNAAEVAAVDQYDNTSTPGDGAGDDYDTATVTPVYADLSLTKTVDTATPNVGGNVVFTLTLTNGGPDTATNIEVTDLLPAGLTYVSDDGGGAYDDGTGVWTVASLGVGSATLNITATVETGAVGGVTNAAEVTAVDQYDNDSTPGDGMGDDYAEATVTPQVADLSLTKTVDLPNAGVGVDVTFTLTLTNGGTDAATNVTVTDLLPAGLTYVSDNPSQGAYTPGTGVWDVGTVAVGSATLEITATVEASAIPSVTNTAEVTTSDQYDGDSTPGNGDVNEDDYAAVTVFTQDADLWLSKTVDNAAPSLNDNVTFTLTVTNDGPGATFNVEVTDLLPAGLTYVSDDGGGAYVSGTGVWTVGDLANGASATLNITATVETTAVGGVTNAAEVTASVANDPDSTPGNGDVNEDDYAAVVVTPAEADLWLSKTVDNAAPGIGDNITFTLTVTNDGPGNTFNVTVTDLLPAGLTYVSDTGGGAYNSGTGLWTVGDLANGASATLDITATVSNDIVGGVTNTAEVTASDAADPDSTPGNGIAGEDDQDSATINASYLPPGYYEETNPAFLYTGDWRFKDKGNASGGTAAKAKVGAMVEFYFAGDVLIIYRRTGPNEQPMEVCIDGDCRVVDNYTPEGEWIQPVSFGVYEPGFVSGPFALAHHVTISHITAGGRFWFDAVEIVNLAAPLPAGEVHQELHPNLLYVTEWAVKTKVNASGGTWVKTGDQDAAVYFRFIGDELTLYRTLGPRFGTMQVCIDGVCQDVSNFNPTKLWAVPWSSGPLADGEHEVMIWNPYDDRITLDAIWAGPNAPASLEEGTPPPTETELPPPPRVTDEPPVMRETEVPPPARETPPPAADRPANAGLRSSN